MSTLQNKLEAQVRTFVDGLMKTIATLAISDLLGGESAPAPAKRGRPKGSKNKPKKRAKAAKKPTTKKRGRPKGSKNKPKAETPAVAPVVESSEQTA